MLRVSDISSPSAFEAELRREELRDRRWRRRCQVIRVVSEALRRTAWIIPFGLAYLLRLLGWL